MGTTAPAGADVYGYLGPDGGINISEYCPTGKCRVLAEVARASRSGPPTSSFEPTIREQALARGLPQALVQAVIKVESNFYPRAVSPKGALGLMQLMPETCRRYNVADPFDPGENIRGGTSFLGDMIERFGNVPLALAAYNAGPGAVDRFGGIPPFDETQAFVRQVLNHYHNRTAVATKTRPAPNAPRKFKSPKPRILIIVEAAEN
ncbi:MAG: lytic transglycosylase domain-containing protein [Pseudomonadota bacterium]